MYDTLIFNQSFKSMRMNVESHMLDIHMPNHNFINLLCKKHNFYNQ